MWHWFCLQIEGLAADRRVGRPGAHGGRHFDFCSDLSRQQAPDGRVLKYFQRVCPPVRVHPSEQFYQSRPGGGRSSHFCNGGPAAGRRDPKPVIEGDHAGDEGNGSLGLPGRHLGRVGLSLCRIRRQPLRPRLVRFVVASYQLSFQIDKGVPRRRDKMLAREQHCGSRGSREVRTGAETSSSCDRRGKPVQYRRGRRSPKGRPSSSPVLSRTECWGPNPSSG